MDKEIMIIEEWLGYSEYEDYKYCTKEEIPIVKAVSKLLTKYKEFCIKNKWTIERIGNLGLCYKTFIGKDATEKDLEICAFNDDGTRFTIASFNYDEDEKYYSLDACGNRLNHVDINWGIFGELVKKAYKILEG